MLIKGTNYIFLHHVSAGSYVQNLFYNSISKIWCTGQEERLTRSLPLYHFWGILNVLGCSQKVKITSFCTMSHPVHMCSTCFTIQFRRFDALGCRTGRLAPCPFIISGAFWTFLDAHTSYKLYISGLGFTLFICSVLVQQFNFEDLILGTGVPKRKELKSPRFCPSSLGFLSPILWLNLRNMQEIHVI